LLPIPRPEVVVSSNSSSSKNDPATETATSFLQLQPLLPQETFLLTDLNLLFGTNDREREREREALSIRPRKITL